MPGNESRLSVKICCRLLNQLAPHALFKLSDSHFGIP